MMNAECAVETELFQEKEALDFLVEKLNTSQWKKEFLVIRKEGEGELHSELGRIFRKYNIWEFKGHRRSSNISIFYKTMSFAYYYLYLLDTSDSIEEVTLSFLRESWPKDLMAWLEKQGYKKIDSPEWVVRYKRNRCPDLQIVNAAHPEAPTMLHILSHKAESKDIQKAVDYVHGIPEEERRKAWQVMSLAIQINKGMKMEGTDMGEFYEAFIKPLERELEQKDAEMEKLKKQLAVVQA